MIKPTGATSQINATLALIASCFLVCTPGRGGVEAEAKTNPDPLLLIQGMVSIRGQIPPSRLRLRATYSSPSVKNDHQYLAEFDGNNRRFVRLAPDRKGEMLCEIAYDGKEVSLYDGVRNISITDLGDPTPGYVGYFFDPRLLGITAWYQPWESIGTYNRFPTNEYHAELAGSEVIDGKQTWHVRQTSAEGTFNWWIDDKDGFRVYRYRVEMGSHGHYDVNASYESGYPWLPTQVDQKNFNASGQLESERHISIVKSEANIVFPADAWSLAGMNLPTDNLSVTDLRLHRIVGFWNGQKIQPFEKAFPLEKALNANLKEGAMFPDFNVKDVKGEPLSIAKYRGKVVLVDFWATWCGPCVSELPNVLKTYKKHHGGGFEIVGISLDQDEKKLTTFLKQKNVSWQQFFDGKGWKNELAAKCGIQGIPATYLLDGEGKIIGKNLRGEALEAAVVKALTKP